MKYIDADKLISEIERRKGFYERTYERLHRDDLESSTSYAIASALDELLSLIASLQQEQPEVDLEKEIARFALNGGTGDNTPTIGETAHHFYELGLNARKK